MTKRKRQVEELFADGNWHQAGEIADRLGVTRQTTHRYLRQLVSDDRLIKSGAGRGTRYRRRSMRLSRNFQTSGLHEDRVWHELSAPGTFLGSLASPAQSTLLYAFTEMVNNVIDHSGAAEVSIRVAKDGPLVVLEIADRGVGIFEHIRDRMGLDSELEALQELSKGKATTMPDRHSGEGIFFTSKAVHEFEVKSGSLRWIVDTRRNDTALGELDPPLEGTVVRLELDTDNVRPLDEVFAEFTENLVFSKTRVVIHLFAIGTKFVSRSEAKRLLHGLEKFRDVVLDFRGVDLVGQGFADEVFRVWARAHSDTHFVPVNMSDPVAFMVERAIRRAKDD